VLFDSLINLDLLLTKSIVQLLTTHELDCTSVVMDDEESWISKVLGLRVLPDSSLFKLKISNHFLSFLFGLVLHGSGWLYLRADLLQSACITSTAVLVISGMFFCES
jgi:hypothetical protein